MRAQFVDLFQQNGNKKDMCPFIFSMNKSINYTEGQIISERLLDVFIWTKNERKYFLLLPYLSKIGQIKKKKKNGNCYIRR